MNTEDKLIGIEMAKFFDKEMNIPKAQLKQMLSPTAMLPEANLTPYILEERKLNVTQMDIFSRLMKDRIIWLAGVVNDRMSTVAQGQLLFLQELDKTAPITMHIDSPGGSIKSGLSIVDTMDLVKETLDIVTVNTGMAASMGSVLLTNGTPGHRKSLRFSKVMCHQASSGASGHVRDNGITHIETEKYNYMLGKLLAKASGKTFEEYMTTVSRDKWYTAEEAKAFGLIDEVVIPEGATTVEELLEGFKEYTTKELGLS